jgi:hypothetical protein
MAPDPRKCEAELADGRRCDELATILGIKYHYTRRPGEAGQVEHHLNETHYHIHCPKCGERTHVEGAD